MPTRRMPYDELSPTTQYRYGARDGVARTAHSDQSREWRRENARAALRPVEGRLIGLIASGLHLREAAEECGVTVQAIHNRARWDRAWSARVDAALMAGRDPSLTHGRSHTYRRSGCRCPECREAHNATRGPRGSH